MGLSSLPSTLLHLPSRRERQERGNMALQALRGRSGPAKGDNSETLCSKNVRGPGWPLVPWGALGGRGCPMGVECGVFPLLQREAPLQCLSSLEVILAVPLPLDRPHSHVPVWWQWREELKR